MSSRATPLDVLLRRWVEGDLITAKQAAAIRSVERVDRVVPVAEPLSVPRASEHTPLVIEALGYLGGVVILIAAALVTGQFWPEISTNVRLGLAVVATLALVGTGLALPCRADDVHGPVRRLVAVLLALGTGGVAASLALVGNEVADWSAKDTALLASAGAAVVAAGLWRLRPSLVQQAVTVTALLVAAATATAHIDGHSSLPGLAVWAGGFVWLLLGWGDWLEPRRAVVPLGAAGMLAGAVMGFGSDSGIALGLLTTVGLALAAVAVRDLLLLAVAAVGAFLVLPAAVNTWFPGSLAAPVALLLIGVLLVAAAFRIARGRGHRVTSSTRTYRQGDRRFAAAAAITVAVGAGLVIVVVGSLF